MQKDLAGSVKLKMQSLITRTLSAAIAIIFIYLLYYFFNDFGLQILIGIGVLFANYELTRILFQTDLSLRQKIFFFICSLTIFSGSALWPHLASLVFSVVFVIYVSFVISLERKFDDLEAAQIHVGKVVLGFTYGSFLPLAIFEVSQSQMGSYWFILLLLLVFVGDTFAYISGMLWGDKKISPRISPKKTLVGAVGGGFGSIVATVSFSQIYLPQLGLGWAILIGLTSGVAGQMGDFFESLMKRVVNVKDSGSIMPGHGGILDRIDGVLFAAPVLLVWIQVLTFQ
jgi:phosphatidate cytidylyltransferase